MSYFDFFLNFIFIVLHLFFNNCFCFLSFLWRLSFIYFSLYLLFNRLWNRFSFIYFWRFSFIESIRLQPVRCTCATVVAPSVSEEILSPSPRVYRSAGAAQTGPRQPQHRRADILLAAPPPAEVLDGLVHHVVQAGDGPDQHPPPRRLPHPAGAWRAHAAGL